MFTTAQDKLVPDPAVYSEWFEQAQDDLRKKAVGVRKYREMEKLLGGRPSWEHFVDPETGDGMKLDALKKEGHADRASRVAQVQALIQQRRHLTREVATFGFLR